MGFFIVKYSKLVLFWNEKYNSWDHRNELLSLQSFFLLCVSVSLKMKNSFNIAMHV